MNQENIPTNWPAIERKLNHETKASLIKTLKELTTVSPQAGDFLHARYLNDSSMIERIKPYQEQIDAQFEGDFAPLDLRQAQQSIQNYQLATGNEKQGTAELWVYALEAAAGFMHSMGLHDLSYQSDLTQLGWECADFLGSVSDLYPLYEKRLQTICGWLNEFGDEGLTEPLYQLEADMMVYPEDDE